MKNKELLKGFAILTVTYVAGYWIGKRCYSKKIVDLSFKRFKEEV